MYIQMNSSSDFMTWKNLAKVCIKHYKIYINTHARFIAKMKDYHCA